MNQTRDRFEAKYLYPGVFMPEVVRHPVPDGTYAAACAIQPDNGWYAVEVQKVAERLYRAENGDEKWVSDGQPVKVGSWIVGDKIHWQDIPDTAENRILRSNLQANSSDGYGVRTRCGNWQIASDYLEVVAG